LVERVEEQLGPLPHDGATFRVEAKALERRDDLHEDCELHATESLGRNEARTDKYGRAVGGDVVTPTAGSTPSSPVSLYRYVLGVVITVLAVVSQYFVPQLWSPATVVYGNLAGDVFVVYGIPVIAFLLLVGLGPLRNWADRVGVATVEGLSWYGGLSLLALVVIVLLAVLYEALDPSALQFINRPNPALEQATGNPWFWVAFSFVVGAFEETIFRGWIFGFWRNRSTSWVIPAVWTSALFAGVHLYYGLTYGAAAPLFYSGLFLTGFAFAATYRWSGGNLVVIALLHGANDATLFYTLINDRVGLALHYGLILVGAVVALIAYLVRPGSEWRSR
jgi:membrane protease YdiL (CAAX protease family)